MQRIPIAGPWITDKEVEYVRDAAARGWYGEAEGYTQRFEQAFAAYLGVRHAVALPSCTSAIHLSLAALGIGPGDEVVVPELTWIASAAPVIYVGATPVFADVDAQTWCLSADSLHEALTPRTRAVIPVDLYGGMPDMGALQALARRHGLALVEDAAEAVGSEHHGRRAGAFGTAGAFSFHGSKTLTTGEGGMLVTDDDALWQRVLLLRDHGRAPGGRPFWNTEVAYKYKMSALQAALGLAQLERVEELVERKRLIFSWYRRRLADVEGLVLNAEPAGTRNSYWMVTALFEPRWGLGKEEAMAFLAGRGIDSRPLFYPLSSLPAFRRLEQAERARRRNRVSYDLGPRGINLPSALSLTQEQVSYVCAQVKDMIRGRCVPVAA
jgi:perosamine synthetase